MSLFCKKDYWDEKVNRREVELVENRLTEQLEAISKQLLSKIDFNHKLMLQILDGICRETGLAMNIPDSMYSSQPVNVYKKSKNK
jgi:hypothetical protein